MDLLVAPKSAGKLIEFPDLNCREKLGWINKANEAPYFVDEENQNWTQIGQNDAITWPDLKGLFRRKDINAVEQYLSYLKANVMCNPKTTLPQYIN
jgi:hypothetical protein